MHCNNTLQNTATYWINTFFLRYATYCNHSLQHTATIRCNTLQRTGSALTCTNPVGMYWGLHCNTMQNTATHCNYTLQHTAILKCNTTLQQRSLSQIRQLCIGPRTATHYNTRQRTATAHCSAHCDSMSITSRGCLCSPKFGVSSTGTQHIVVHQKHILQRTATYCNVLQRNATYCNVLQRTAS